MNSYNTMNKNTVISNRMEIIWNLTYSTQDRAATGKVSLDI